MSIKEEQLVESSKELETLDLELQTKQLLLQKSKRTHSRKIERAGKLKSGALIFQTYIIRKIQAFSLYFSEVLQVSSTRFNSWIFFILRDQKR